jgi:hypothetical protein
LVNIFKKIRRLGRKFKKLSKEIIGTGQFLLPEASHGVWRCALKISVGDQEKLVKIN